MCPTYWRRCEKALKADTAHFGNWRRMFEARLWTRPLPAQKGKAWNCSRSEDWHIHKFFPGILQKYATSILRVSTQGNTMVDAWCVYVLNMQSLDMAFKGIFCSSYATLVTYTLCTFFQPFPTLVFQIAQSTSSNSTIFAGSLFLKSVFISKICCRFLMNKFHYLYANYFVLQSTMYPHF